MAKTTLNGEGESSAHALIRAGHYDSASPWSFDAEDGDKLLGPKGDDWAKFGRWHLGEDPSEPETTKAHWKYPYGKDGKVYRRAVSAIRSRASQQGDTTIFDAAGRLMSSMDDEEGKKESAMSGLRHILGSIGGSRFGHFAAAAKPPAKDPDDGKPEDGDEEARAAAAKKAEEDEEMRKAEREKDEAARRARRARRARKGKHAKDPDDDDEAADDDEDEEDEEEMKKAAAAGHSFALDAAFRAGARAQRIRCGRIFDAKAASANPVLAASLAFETSLTAGGAIALLEKTPAPRGNLLAERMAMSGAGEVRIGPGAPAGATGPAAIAASWDGALKPFAPPAGR